MKHILPSVLFLVLSLMAFPNFAQKIKTDKALEAKIREISADFHGDVGVYVYHTKKHKEVAIKADTIFPTASIVKVPILVGVFHKIKSGELKYRQPLQYSTDQYYGGSGLMQYFQDSTKTDLSTAITLMITFSDNVASLWCQDLAGGGAEINRLMAEYGLEHTRVNSRTPGRQKIWEKYGWGQTTPREMAQLMLKIRNGEIIDPVYSERMYRHLTHIFYDENAVSSVPPYVQTASKQGAVDASRSEVVLVNAPHGDFVMYIGTKNNEDTSWGSDKSEAQALIRAISKAIWEHFEPGSKWENKSNGMFL